MYLQKQLIFFFSFAYTPKATNFKIWDYMLFRGVINFSHEFNATAERKGGREGD